MPVKLSLGCTFFTQHDLRGSKQDIADGLAQINGEVREAIIFVDDPAPAGQASLTPDVEDIFAEMRAFMVDVENVDDSREAIYTRRDDE